MTENHYRVLGLNNFASLKEIKLAYRSLAKKYHPDRNAGYEEQFKRITHSYNELLNDDKRNLLNEWLKAPVRGPYRSSTEKPRYTKRTAYYTSEKVHYTPKVKMYGAIFTIIFLMCCTLVPIWLMYKASNNAYNEGLEYMKSGDSGSAIMSYDRAITWFGQRSGEAAIKAARIGLFINENPEHALLFINKGFEYASKKEDLAELHYLNGRVLKKKGKYESAVSAFNTAMNWGYSIDSVQIQLGILNAFYMEEFDLAIDYFEKALESNTANKEALFGKAWCLQKMNLPKESIGVYNHLLTVDSLNVLGLFYRGHNNIVLGDSIAGCKDFQNAFNLGYQPALVYLINQCR